MARADEPLGGLPRNFIRPCLLLLLGEAEAHGYDLLMMLGAFGLDRADPGGLYRTLRGMEQDGLVRSWWEHSDAGPARRVYALTDEGGDWLHAWAGTLREVHRTLAGYLDRYDALVAEASSGASPAR